MGMETYLLSYLELIKGYIFAFISSIVIIVPLLGLWYYWFKNRNYNIWCNILSEREGGSGKYIGDRGAFLKNKDGSHVFRLKKAKIQIPQPSFKNYLVPASRSGLFVKNALFLKQISQSEYVPIEPKRVFDGSTTYKTLDPQLDFWRVISNDKARQKYFKANWTQTYGPMLGLGILAGVFIVVFYLLMTNASAYIASMSRISENLLEAIRVQSSTISTTAQAITPPPSPSSSPF